jgi:hypothetical protein
MKHARAWAQAAFAIFAMALLAYALLWERHEVRSLADEKPTVLNGVQFIAGTTTDDYMRRPAGIYDVRSLAPSSASVKDCKT